MYIDVSLVHRLVSTQFSEWKDLSVRPVSLGGWDNRTFHLGEEMLVRMPSAAEYAVQVEKEHLWLSRLAPKLPLQIPMPLALGKPGEGYPWPWSIYRWIEGDTAASTYVPDLRSLANQLAEFLNALQQIDSTDGPLPGSHNFYRGGALSTYDAEILRASAALKGKIDTKAAMDVWETAIATKWDGPPVWVHGDISSGNLLVQEGQLTSVIDFGLLSIGDPACDLAIAWTFFKEESREVFRRGLPLDSGTWARGRAWALWKAIIIAAGFAESNSAEAAHPWNTIAEVLDDYFLQKMG